jgi:hypothetical protein
VSASSELAYQGQIEPERKRRFSNEKQQLPGTRSWKVDQARQRKIDRLTTISALITFRAPPILTWTLSPPGTLDIHLRALSADATALVELGPTTLFSSVSCAMARWCLKRERNRQNHLGNDVISSFICRRASVSGVR